MVLLKIGFLKVVKRMRLFFFVSFGNLSAFFPSDNRLSSLKNAETPLEIIRKTPKRQFLEMPQRFCAFFLRRYFSAHQDASARFEFI